MWWGKDRARSGARLDCVREGDGDEAEREVGAEETARLAKSERPQLTEQLVQAHATQQPGLWRAQPALPPRAACARAADALRIGDQRRRIVWRADVGGNGGGPVGRAASAGEGR